MTTTAAARTAGPQPSGEHGAPMRATATPRWWADVAAAGAGLSLVAVVALWVSNRGLQQLFGGGPDAVSAVGRLTGLVAADLLLLQVLLMARVPLVERAFGQDRLARWHRWTGFTSLHLIVAHIALITLGYAAALPTGVVAELWDMIVSYPGMLLATAGTLLLVMVVVTSVRAARRRLRYESWHLLHLYAYLGVGLALPHQLWTGADFISSPVARAYWWTLYTVSAGAGPGLPVRSARVAQRAAPAQRQPRRVGRPRAHLGVPARPPAGEVARTGGAVLPVAVPQWTRLVAVTSVLFVGRSPP
jgi:DMSO/TMAO reductase YedYZ heme-binding membrane subunit